MKNKIKCPKCNKMFKPKFRFKYVCTCPDCKIKIELYKKKEVSKFLNIVSITTFLILITIAKYVSYLLKENLIVVSLVLLIFTYPIINPIFYYGVIHFFNKNK